MNRIRFLKNTTLLLAAALLCGLCAASAGTADVYAPLNEDLAVRLQDLGLLKGDATGFALERAPTRSEGAVMLVRLLGKEKEALQAAGKSTFTDAGWADSYLAYLQKNNIARGKTDSLFGGNDLLRAQEYVTFVLRALGYDDARGDFRYADALEFAEHKGLLSQVDRDRYRAASFLRDDMIYISWRALSVALNGSSRLLVNRLIDAGAVPVGAYELVTSAQPDGTLRVGERGRLQVAGSSLCDRYGQPIQLRGVSSHGLQWYSQFVNKNALKYLRDNWRINVFRLAMYTENGGYIANPDEMRQHVINGVEAAIALDMYVIIDWHILSDGNPLKYKEQSKAFFREMSARYKDVPNVLYEICNEPNGVSWDGGIRGYAEELVQVIRENDPHGVILVGSGSWSQDIHDVARHPLDNTHNVMYTFHFFAGTHGQELRSRLQEVHTAGLPVFVSEWGVSNADGTGGVFAEESDKWLNLLDRLNISWVNWSLCDKAESSALLRPGASVTGFWDDAALSEAGKYVRGRLLR